MKRNVSLRLRLTLSTSILLILTCALYTVFSFYNAHTNIVDPLISRATVSYEEGMELEQSKSEPLIEAGETDTIRALMMSPAAKSLAPESPFSLYSFVFMGLTIIAGTAGMYILSGIALKPAKRLAREISRVDRENLSARIEDFKAGDELQSISQSFNHMMERLEAAFLRESRFSAAAAHELKTPLTAIRTNLDVLLMDRAPTPEEYTESIAVVKKQTRRMSTLVDQLAMLSGTGTLVREETVDLKRITDEIIAEQETGGLTLTADLSPVSVAGNSVMLKHAFTNLVQNAVRYNCEGGSISISLFQHSGICSFTVKDTGMGVSEEDAAHIFEPFYRADKSRSRALGGSGLGLAIVKEIVEEHGGTVSYRKNSPKGSVFQITLPC